MISKIELKNPVINGAAYINLNAMNISFPWECYTSVTGTPKKDIDGTINAGLGRGVNTGFNNPTVSVNGVYQLGTTHITGSSATIDFEYIEELIRRSDQICTLKCDFFVTTTNIEGEIKVLVKNITPSNSNSNVVNYVISMIRVKEE